MTVSWSYDRLNEFRGKRKRKWQYEELMRLVTVHSTGDWKCCRFLLHNRDLRRFFVVKSTRKVLSWITKAIRGLFARYFYSHSISRAWINGNKYANRINKSRACVCIYIFIHTNDLFYNFLFQRVDRPSCNKCVFSVQNHAIYLQLIYPYGTIGIIFNSSV